MALLPSVVPGRPGADRGRDVMLEPEYEGKSSIRGRMADAVASTSRRTGA
ncbi:hypothetical protein A33K_12739 [Burkholderia humptydooensis MSMB43]|uniref:Uncharacterized protein n=1 Tax=Burkholderia humptydooensis MSMB43 TaxID=441157 RepID=A0ABN0GA26_9BURK|nr:hypothetical protein A33K_12739 [Burkholderia humptydooensis MSMB43]